jgi:hypothetical protein
VWLLQRFPVFNVVNYGAVGDGATDNTAAINAAIQAASAVSGATVYFPAGTWDYSNNLTFSSLNVAGAGSSTILQPTNPTNTAVILTGTNSSIRNLVISSTSLAGLGSAGWTFSIPNTANLLVQNATSFTVANITCLQRVAGCGIAILGGNGGTVNAVSCTGSGNPNLMGNGSVSYSYGIFIWAPNVTVSNSLIQNECQAIEICGGNNIAILSNTIGTTSSPIGGFGIWCFYYQGGSNLTISQNTIVMGGFNASTMDGFTSDGPLYVQNCTNLTVSNNNMYGGYAGPSLGNDLGTNSITGNYITNVGKLAFEAVNVPGQITNNKFGEVGIIYSSYDVPNCVMYIADDVTLNNAFAQVPISTIANNVLTGHANGLQCFIWICFPTSPNDAPTLQGNTQQQTALPNTVTSPVI